MIREAIALWLRRLAERLAPIGPPPSYLDAVKALRRDLDAELDVAAERYAKRLQDGGIPNCEVLGLGSYRCPPYPPLYRVK